MLRAMIVDDEAPARSELRFMLEQTGKIGTITEASSVRSAIEMLMESRVDVVFLDISMPGASGLQLAEALHKLKNPPAIAINFGARGNREEPRPRCTAEAGTENSRACDHGQARRHIR